MRVLVSDKFPSEGLQVLEQAEGIELDYQPGLTTEQLLGAVAEVDALIDAARATGDTAKQAEIYKELQHKLVDMQSDVFLLTQTVQHAMDKCLTGFNAVPMQSFDYDFTRYQWKC